MLRLIDHSYIVSTILFKVYSQLIMRWQVSQAGTRPVDSIGRAQFFANLFFNPWVLSSIFAMLFAGISWMLAMRRFEISYAYPWLSLSFVLILIFGVFLFDEPFNFAKVLGTILAIAGIAIIAQS